MTRRFLYCQPSFPSSAARSGGAGCGPRPAADGSPAAGPADAAGLGTAAAAAPTFCAACSAMVGL
eukprot:5977058-Alexandrium_andersonii.AAC.1